RPAAPAQGRAAGRATPGRRALRAFRGAGPGEPLPPTTNRSAGERATGRQEGREAIECKIRICTQDYPVCVEDIPLPVAHEGIANQLTMSSALLHGTVSSSVSTS